METEMEMGLRFPQQQHSRPLPCLPSPYPPCPVLCSVLA